MRRVTPIRSTIPGMKLIALFFAVIALGMLAGSFLAIPKAKWGQVALLFIAAILMGGAAAAINAAA